MKNSTLPIILQRIYDKHKNCYKITPNESNIFKSIFIYIYFFLLIVIHTTSWDCSSLPKSLSMQSFTFVFFMLWFTFQLIGWLVAYISLVNKNGKLIRKILLEPRQLNFFLNFVFIKHTLTAVCDGFVLAKKKITNLYVFVLFANLHALYLIYRLGLGMDLHSYLFYKTHSTFHYETTKAQILKRTFSFLLILILTQSCTLWLWYLTVVLEQSAGVHLTGMSSLTPLQRDVTTLSCYSGI